MTEYRKQADFLKALMALDDSPESRRLLERLAHAERNERCLLGACFLVALIAAFGVAGLGYSAVLLDRFFDNSTHVVIRIFGALSLGSVLCLVFFAGLWFWYRSGVNRVHEEFRQVIFRMVEARLNPPSVEAQLLIIEQRQIEALPAPAPGLVPERLRPLPKAS